MTPTHLALFDLDHTLLPFDSDYQWAEFLARTGRAGDPAEARRRNDELMRRYNEGTLSAEEAADFMLGLLRLGRPDELDRWHLDYMAEIVEPGIPRAARELVARGQTRAGAPEARIAVRDFGPGIAPEHLPRLTERFYRVDVADSRSQGGTGLGLALVKHILNRHGGRVAVESVLGQGATFTMHLPLHTDPASSG